MSTFFWIVSHASGVGRRSFARKAVADSNLVFAETICHIVHNCPSVLSIMRAGMCGKEGFFTLLGGTMLACIDRSAQCLSEGA